MNANEFISTIKSRGATLYAPVDARDIELTNANLGAQRRAVAPAVMREFWTMAGGANMGSGYIFGPREIDRGTNYPVPSIIKVNNDISNISEIAGKTVFGRNDLFWFAFDAFGTFYMLDNLALRVLRKYEDGWRAMSDCLMGGRF